MTVDEIVARAVRNHGSCGLTVEGEYVFCDDPRLDGPLDAYERSLRCSECACKAIVPAIRAELDKAGYVIAPREPNDAMRLASKRYKASAKVYSGPACYRAMLAASQEVGK